MDKPTITELLNVFAFYLSDGMENAVRVFPQHRNWLVQQEGKTFREVESELLKSSRKLLKADKKQAKSKKIFRRTTKLPFIPSTPATAGSGR